MGTWVAPPPRKAANCFTSDPQVGALNCCCPTRRKHQTGWGSTQLSSSSPWTKHNRLPFPAQVAAFLILSSVIPGEPGASPARLKVSKGPCWCSYLKKWYESQMLLGWLPATLQDITGWRVVLERHFPSGNGLGFPSPWQEFRRSGRPIPSGKGLHDVYSLCMVNHPTLEKMFVVLSNPGYHVLFAWGLWQSSKPCLGRSRTKKLDMILLQTGHSMTVWYTRNMAWTDD